MPGLGERFEPHGADARGTADAPTILGPAGRHVVGARFMTERLELGPFVAMRAQAFSYVRIDARGYFDPRQLVAALSDPRLGQFIAESRRAAVLLNASAVERIGTEDTEWLSTQWAPMIAGIGVRKLSLVTPEHVHQLFGAVFLASARTAARAGVELRCFPSAQFHQSWESVSWFDDAGGAGASGSPSGAPQNPPSPSAAQAPPSTTPRVPSGGSLEVTVPRHHWKGIFHSAVLGGLVIGAATMLAGIVETQSMGLTELEGMDGLGLFAALAGGLSAFAGTSLVLNLRGRPPTRVVWDEHTISEQVGGRARVTFERARVHATWAWTTVRFVRGRRVVADRIGGRMLQLSDGGGQTITLAEGGFVAPWLRHRACWVTSFEPLLKLVPEAVEGRVVPDERAIGPTASRVFGTVAVLSYAAFAASVLFTRTRSGPDAAKLLFLVGAALFGLRALWPAARLLRRLPGEGLASGVELALRLGATALIGLPIVVWLLRALLGA